ncbi:Efflux pump FUS6 [Fusarium culmorum]|uniref:Efflux pump FUS6 n=1 Tax=Fusarium culmorum TaxID=5516 RepID=A0A2T4H2R0_FUSCU|nr:Efflux pump FUS6 [Fusarium culmorum]
MTTPEVGYSSPQLVVDDNTTSRPQTKMILPEEKNLTSAVTLLGASGTTTSPLASINESDSRDPPSSLGASSIQIKGIGDMSSTTTRGWRFYGAFGTLCLVTFIIALDSTIICVALPTIAEDIGTSAIEAFWCGTSFLLASTVVQPPIASLSHIFGRRTALLASVTIFAGGSIMAALAKNVSVLLVGRTLQGLGSGGILALTYVIATNLVSLRERGKWFGLISLNWAIGSILGPLIGGALVEVSWPWLFWINLPFCGVAYIMIPITMRIKRKEDASVNTKIKEFDWIGTIIFVATVVPLVFGILGLIAFGVHIKFCRRYSRCDPLLRPSLPTLPPLSMVSSCGVAVLPFTGTVAPAAVVVGLLIAKTGTYRPFIWAGWTLVPLGMGLMMLLEKDTETYKWVLIYLTGGLGLGILYSAQAFAAQASASNSDLPFAASMYAFCRSLGQGIGVAVGGVTFQNEFRKQIEKSTEFALKADEWAKDASALVQIVKKSPASMQLMRDTIINGYIKGLRTVWMVLTLVACVALVVSLVGVKAKSLDRKFETEHELDQGAGQRSDKATPDIDV